MSDISPPARPNRATPSAVSASLADLTWLNIADMFTAFGLPRAARLRGPFELLCRLPARRFAEDLVAFDDLVGARGLGAGGAWMVARLCGSLELRGPPLPPSGPLLVVANHPGLLDAAALFAAIGRPDLRVLAADRPFLRALPHIAAALIAVGSEPATRTAALRTAVRHLRDGGALLSFPAGKIEPDPLSLPGAAAALAGWSDSAALFARLAGELTIVPAIVGGTISASALRHPLLRLRRSPSDRQWLAAIIQLMLPQRFPVRVRVQRAPPLSATHSQLGAAARAAAAQLIQEIDQP
jgi:1-acyl-sn-glycerol-3-phosphate acyltransferase